jgi:hypothetical protein
MVGLLSWLLLSSAIVVFPLHARSQISEKEAEKEMAVLESSASLPKPLHRAARIILRVTKQNSPETKLGARSRIVVATTKLNWRLSEEQLSSKMTASLLMDLVYVQPWDTRFALESVVMLGKMCRTMNHESLRCEEIVQRLVQIKGHLPAHNSFAAKARFELAAMRVEDVVDDTVIEPAKAAHEILESLPFFAATSDFARDMRVLLIRFRQKALIDSGVLNKDTMLQFLCDIEKRALDSDWLAWVKDVRNAPFLDE